MNDPQVVALNYTVEHGTAVSYENATPLSDCKSPEFDLTVDDNIARFELKKHYADEDEARAALEPLIRHWEFVSEIRGGPGSFRLRYTNPEIIDRNPPPPEPGVQHIRASVHLGGTLSVKAEHTVLKTHYPPLPTGGPVDPDDDAVVKMTRQYEMYRLGRLSLAHMAYFCVTVLEEEYGGRVGAAKKCGVSKNVLDKIATLASEKGGEGARKARGADHEFTNKEKRFLNQAVAEIIIRAAQVAADDSQRHPQITKGNLPSI